MRRLALASVLSIVLAAAPAALANAVFVTPMKKLYCEIVDTSPRTLVCWRPSNGWTLRMTATGTASGATNNANKGRYDSKPARLLDYGKTWGSDGWACSSRKIALICINDKGHGWAVAPNSGSHTF